MRKKKALIFGITGQDGSYLTRFLLSKNYLVHGVIRRSSNFNTQRIDDIYTDPHERGNLKLHYGDVTDTNSVLKIIKKIKPSEIYNLSAQSHVGVSFMIPEYTANVDALGTLRILESILTLGFTKKVKYYQAGSSEMFGNAKAPQNERTNFEPRSPYAVAKLYAHWITINYRESYNLFAANGILFNHESPVRGGTFVTKKIVEGLCKIKKGMQEKLYLGNLYAKRDWGHAEDYVKAMWLILQQKKPDDFVIATGQNLTVKKFVEKVAKKLELKINWVGKGLREKGICNGKTIIQIDKRYLRPSEVNNLQGDYRKSKKILKWKPKKTIDNLIDDMISHQNHNTQIKKK